MSYEYEKAVHIKSEWKKHWPAGAEQLRDHQSVSPALCCPYSQRPPGPDTSSKQTQTEFDYISQYSHGFSHRLVIKSDPTMKVTTGCLNNAKTITCLYWTQYENSPEWGNAFACELGLKWLTY